MSTINPDTAYSSIYSAIARERDRQDVKWGEQNHPNGTGGGLAEELARQHRGACQRAADEGRTTWRLILLEEVYEALAEGDPALLRKELIQVAAVAVQWIEAIDRRRTHAGSAPAEEVTSA
jgi:hypothetical protein